MFPVRPPVICMVSRARNHLSNPYRLTLDTVLDSQAPILPPISCSPSLSLQSIISLPWNLPAAEPAAGVPVSGGAACTPPPCMEGSSKMASPSNTVPNTPTFSSVRPPAHPVLAATSARPVSPGDADEPDHEESAAASSSDTDAHSNTDDGDKNSTVYTGVSRSGLNGRWRAQLSTRGRTVHLGTFASAEEAARAWDRAAVQERGKAAVTNFAISDYINADGSLKTEAGCNSQDSKGQREDECSSRGHKSFRGVYHSGTYGRWKARIVVKGHKIHLGTFASAEDAARAWDLKALEYHGAGTVTNFDASIYASGKVPAPREVEDKSSDDDNLDSSTSSLHIQGPAADRKRSRSTGSTSPTPSDLSDQGTPRAPADSPPSKQRKKHPASHVSPTGTTGSKRPWEFLGHEEEDAKQGDAGVREPTHEECVAFSSLLSLCAAAEAMGS